MSARLYLPNIFSQLIIVTPVRSLSLLLRVRVLFSKTKNVHWSFLSALSLVFSPKLSSGKLACFTLAGHTRHAIVVFFSHPLLTFLTHTPHAVRRYHNGGPGGAYHMSARRLDILFNGRYPRGLWRIYWIIDGIPRSICYA